MKTINRTSIEWTDYSHNTVVGCEHGCWYCYAERLTKRFPKLFPNGFKPTFHPERLQDPWKLKKPSKIFVCSISDLFAPWTHEEWRYRTILNLVGCPVKHTFQLLTKNPERIPLDFKFPKNFWIGTTVTCENEDWRNLEQIKKVECGVKFASFEPLLGMLPKDISLKGLDWIIIGKLTGSSRVKLDAGWVWRIFDEARALEIPIFLKNNLLKTNTATFPRFQQFPGQEMK